MTQLTPMMRQYREVKQQLPPDAVLMFRLGDFYELFFEDAAKIAPILEVVLTSRAGMPMCGIPYHALEAYLPKLLDAGLKVAIAEQMEDPKLAKGIVKREITRIITPGTLSDSALITSPQANFLMAFLPFKNGFAIASLDLSTAEFKMTQLPDEAALHTELSRVGPREILISESVETTWKNDPSLKFDFLQNQIITAIPDYVFTQTYAETFLQTHFKVKSLDAFGAQEAPYALIAAAAALYYVGEQLHQKVDHIRTLRLYHSEHNMVIDPVTLRHLELVDPLPGHTKESTLFYHLNQTVTPMGTRLLREWMLRPLLETRAIRQRLHAVASFVENPLLLEELRESLSPVRDLERITARINLGSVSPRDFLALRYSLESIPGIKLLLNEHAEIPLIQNQLVSMDPMPELLEKLQKAIAEETPNTVGDGGVFADGFDAELDTLRQASIEGKKWLANIQLREQERTGIKSLKVQFNRVFGYYIEVSKSNLHAVPEDYIRKQTMVNAERFITPELKDLEAKILGADDKAKALELQLFSQLRSFAASFTAQLQTLAQAMATVDCISTLADLAVKHQYVQPTIVEEPVMEIIGGRHPVLDLTLVNERFIPNNTCLDDAQHRMMIITGPNMAGKSTYIRQTALLVILAQMGAFLPAERATVGVADRIFTRIGASDDIARGQSTFMVEMVETANILNHATDRSLVILDEIGRGTSTFDGLAIAWAVAEALHHGEGCGHPRTQFATHYHELTELSLICPAIQNYNVAVKEYGEQIIFLRQIVPGAADKSYGIHVAKLAGLPRSVVLRAFEILDNLERNTVSDAGEPVLAEHVLHLSEEDGLYGVDESGMAHEELPETVEMDALPDENPPSPPPEGDQLTFDFGVL